MTVEILDLYDKRRVLRKIRFEPEGSEKYEEVNNNTKRCMKKAKENWTGEQYTEIEENLRKNNSKSERLDQCRNKGKLLLSKIVEKNASQKNQRY